MRNLADLRGPITPFTVGKDGEVSTRKSNLKEQLVAAGYFVKDHRIAIEPQSFAVLEQSPNASSSPQ